MREIWPLRERIRGPLVRYISSERLLSNLHLATEHRCHFIKEPDAHLEPGSACITLPAGASRGATFRHVVEDGAIMTNGPGVPQRSNDASRSDSSSNGGLFNLFSKHGPHCKQ